MTITSLRSTRTDGRVIEPGISVADMIALHWPPSSVTKVDWRHDGKQCSVTSPYGLSAIAVPGGRYVALIESTDANHDRSLLRIISADGRSSTTLSNAQEICGRMKEGRFEWFQQPQEVRDGSFGVVFRVPNFADAFLLDVHAPTAAITAVKVIRA